MEGMISLRLFGGNRLESLIEKSGKLIKKKSWVKKNLNKVAMK